MVSCRNFCGDAGDAGNAIETIKRRDEKCRKSFLVFLFIVEIFYFHKDTFINFYKEYLIKQNIFIGFDGVYIYMNLVKMVLIILI